MNSLILKNGVVSQNTALIEEYRQVVAQRYTPSTAEDMSRVLSTGPYVTSRKIDGELWFLSVEDSGTYLIAANGRTATGDSEIYDAAKNLPIGVVLAGELHVPNKEGRERVGDVSSSLANGGDGLAFAAFDLIAHPDFEWRDSQFADRLAELRKIVPASSGPLSAVEQLELATHEDIQKMFTEVTEKQSGEGIVVRCSDGRILKIKPSITLDLVIIGFTVQSAGATGQEEVRSVLLGLTKADGSVIPVGSAGNAIDGFDRQLLLKRLSPTVIPSEYRQAASTGQLYQAVKPEIIVECRMLDIQSTDSQGKAIRKPSLRIADNSWQVEKFGPAISLINAILLRTRDDKPDVPTGTRWEQLPEKFLSGSAVSVQIGESKIIRRQVWTKEGKDKVDVRKLVVWKTNKEQDPSYPAFVIHWTDFSVGRKAPLAREVKVASNEKDALSVADAMVEENIKKGWNEVK